LTRKFKEKTLSKSNVFISLESSWNVDT
jgi:hypothetical protein